MGRVLARFGERFEGMDGEMKVSLNRIGDFMFLWKYRSHSRPKRLMSERRYEIRSDRRRYEIRFDGEEGRGKNGQVQD
jgi:hypothetical protein